MVCYITTSDDLDIIMYLGHVIEVLMFVSVKYQFIIDVFKIVSAEYHYINLSSIL
jgi:hypothetical protein